MQQEMKKKYYRIKCVGVTGSRSGMGSFAKPRNTRAIL